MEYREKWNQSKTELIVSDKPLYVVLEVNSYCNLKCRMCEKNFHTRPTMKSQALFRRKLFFLRYRAKGEP